MGPDAKVVRRLAQFIKDLGLTHVAYKSDREPAIRNLFFEAAKNVGIRASEATDEELGEDCVVPAAVPEESAVGESQSNSLAEKRCKPSRAKLAR